MNANFGSMLFAAVSTPALTFTAITHDDYLLAIGILANGLALILATWQLFKKENE